ncbi:uncharacterized protein LOC106057925 [Biomphalaria glabrata]|uniref:Uncharacterized protein LOC106057925 n=1 Tax=Biomphalaria glabrata TaxID=6526 RepID=A0A9W2ZE27_BIOGL|nr:uncharacterized protein LOC106057925 [Biomphalaria glabrata]XP_055873213.1 uncharacterized protein LOC106057925 [Biomphalaria glabrata]KAI8752182.1 serine/threonine-protein kinase svkA-like [Biomphalaria glabrata]
MSAVHHEMTSESTDSTMSLESTLSDEVPKNYQFEDVPFGEGAQGKVYRLKNDERFVVKKISVNNPKDATKHKDLRELNVLRTLDRHERIVPFYGYVPLEFELLLFMGFMEMGSLKQYIRNNGALDEARTRLYTIQILEGVSYLHNLKDPIIHRDIKGENVLLEDEYHLRLTDFGVSKVISDLTNARSDIGTFSYRAPETFDPYKSYDFKADIWSVGCTVFEMASGTAPFESTFKNQVEAVAGIGEGLRPDIEFNKCSCNLKKFWDKCFEKDPSQRPTADDLLANDDFLKQVE